MCGMAQMTTSGVHRNIRYYEKCSPERGKQIGGLLHLPILKKQFRIFREYSGDTILVISCQEMLEAIERSPWPV
jgi:hypothetical protein